MNRMVIVESLARSRLWVVAAAATLLGMAFSALGAGPYQWEEAWYCPAGLTGVYTLAAASDFALYAPVSPGFDVGCETGLMRTGDGGATWNRVEGYPLAAAEFVYVSPDYVFYVYNDSLLVSDDGGFTWTGPSSSPGATGLRPLDMAFAGGVAYLAGRGGLYAATDRGNRVWNRLYAGGDLQMVEVSPQGDLFILGESGLLRSGDKGGSWEVLSGSAASVSDMAERSLLVSRDGAVFSAAIGGLGYLYRSSDDGDTWEQVSQPRGGWALLTQLRDSAIWYSDSTSVHRSTDGGNTWEQIGDSFTRRPGWVVEDSSGRVYTHFWGSDTRVFRLADAARTQWRVYRGGSSAPRPPTSMPWVSLIPGPPRGYMQQAVDMRGSRVLPGVDRMRFGSAAVGLRIFTAGSVR